MGRFINADGIIGANGGIMGYNMFAYCNNNPVNYFDLRGYSCAYCNEPHCDGYCPGDTCYDDTFVVEETDELFEQKVFDFSFDGLNLNVKDKRLTFIDAEFHFLTFKQYFDENKEQSLCISLLNAEAEVSMQLDKDMVAMGGFSLLSVGYENKIIGLSIDIGGAECGINSWGNKTNNKRKILDIPCISVYVDFPALLGVIFGVD